MAAASFDDLVADAVFTMYREDRFTEGEGLTDSTRKALQAMIRKAFANRAELERTGLGRQYQAIADRVMRDASLVVGTFLYMCRPPAGADDLVGRYTTASGNVIELRERGIVQRLLSEYMPKQRVTDILVAYGKQYRGYGSKDPLACRYNPYT